MAHEREGTVVVAVDGSEKDDLVVDWGADQAARVSRGLHIIHCIDVVSDPLGSVPTVDLSKLGEKTTQYCRERAESRHPGLTVTTEAFVEDAAVALIRASRYARGIVLGASSKGRLAGRLLGSVAQKVAAHAHGPIAVVRGPAPVPDGPVVVGVDPGDTVPQVLEYAFLQAELRGVGLRIVHAQRRSSGGTEARSEATELSQLTDEWSRRHPDVAVEVVKSTGHPMEALIEESSRGCLLVVGSRGRRGFIGTRLGSVARGVLQEAAVVVVVRVAAPD